MKKFRKVYVGKGQMPKEELPITRITMKMEDLKKLAYEFEGQQMVTVEVAKMKKPDNYNRTHTVYGTVITDETPLEPGKKTTRKKK